MSRSSRGQSAGSREVPNLKKGEVFEARVGPNRTRVVDESFPECVAVTFAGTKHQDIFTWKLDTVEVVANLK